MKISAVVLGLSASLLSISAVAHPDGHEYDMKPLATSCADLAYPSRYETDAAYPEIKALIARCEAAQKKATAPKVKAKAKAKASAKPVVDAKAARKA